LKTVAIRCEHVSGSTQLNVSEDAICYIQCGLIQVALDPSQTVAVRCHCNCMEARMYAHPTDPARGYVTVDPSQVDLGGEFVTTWPIG
jgi:hypothetical protein